ncbi:MAG TPA: hypothetical protein VHB74_06945 [Devosia sp.]|nr:hypothetical protein [Devosia sp.]
MLSLLGRMRLLVLVAVALAGTAPALADSAPFPAPRPGFLTPPAAGASSAPSATDVNAEPSPAEQAAERQQRIKQGLPGAEGDALMPPTQAQQEIASLPKIPQPVSLTAEISEKGAQISDGLIWRVYNSKPDDNGQLALIARSEDAKPTLKLNPGDYVVHVAYGEAQASDTLSVRTSPAKKNIVLDAGGLKLNAAITGDIPIPIDLLHFDVFTAGTTDADRTAVAEKVAPGDILTLNAGTYHIVSYFGDVNAVVRADLRVEPGQLTEATLYHKAAQASFKLVSEAGGEAIADVDWTVKTKDGQTVFTNTGTFPATVLEAGDYTVFAKRGDKVYNRAFQVTPGKPEDIEVLTSVY